MLLAQAGTLATVFLVSLVSILLNASGLELVSGRDLDLNRELRSAGLANLLTGVAGGMVGFQSLSLSTIDCASARLIWASTRTKFLAITLATLLLNAGSVIVGATIAMALPTDLIQIAAGVVFLGFAAWTLRSDGSEDGDPDHGRR